MQEYIENNSSKRCPVIAIVGRPNVGKSSLFNAIIGRRLAIVHEMSGVTRDRVSAAAKFENRRFTIIDTGGLGMLDGETKHVDVWDAGIAAQVAAAVESADLLIMVGDAQRGVTPLDCDVAMRLRQSGKPLLFAANKCDNDDLKNDAAEFTQLGFDKVYPVCCLRKGGVNSLLQAAMARLPEDKFSNDAIEEKINIAIVGRPNVGKSSLINALIGDERVMASPVAGTTRDAVDVDFAIEFAGETHPAVLVDTAGLRKNTKVDTVVELFSVMRAKSAIERADLVIFVVEAGVDSITAQDRRIAGMIQKAGKACIIAVNKIDLRPGVSVKDLARELRDELPNLNYAPAEFISAAGRRRLDTLIDRMADVMEQLNTEITTGVLNRVITDAVERHAPPVVGNAALKIFYSLVVAMRPPKVRIFVNRTELAADNYISFLKKEIRQAFGLNGVPVEIELKARPKRIASIRRDSEKKKKRR